MYSIIYHKCEYPRISNAAVKLKKRTQSNRTVSAPGTARRHRVGYIATKVLDDIGNVPDSFAVGNEIPTSRTVAAIVQPRAKDEVTSDTKENTASISS